METNAKFVRHKAMTISGGGNSRLQIWSRMAIVALFGSIFLVDVGALDGFGMRGPYTHDRVTDEAFRLFAKRTGFEIRYDCAELISQSNTQADVFYPMKPEYHCDNSEFYKCSHQLDKLKSQSLKNPNYIDSIRQIGLSTHIVQDFYAHSNWVEIARNSYTMAPIENLKEFFLMVPQLQSGYHPFSPEGEIQDMVDCYLFPEELWGNHILGATHGCMEKDSNFSLRGSTIADSPFGFGRTYHEIAGELAIEHTAKLLQFFFDRRHPHLMSCLVPTVRGIGCNQYMFGRVKAAF